MITKINNGWKFILIKNGTEDKKTVDEPYKSDDTNMLLGVASVAIRHDPFAGRARITAYADGMQCGECVISMSKET